MIAFKLREDLDPELSSNTVKSLIKDAKVRIIRRYGIPVEEFKGDVIAFWEWVMRGRSFDLKNGAPAKMCDRIRAVENLTSLLNLEDIAADDTADSARKWREMIKSDDKNADKSQGDAASDDNKPSTNEEQGDGKESKEDEQGK